jgi:hypothetical protein
MWTIGKRQTWFNIEKTAAQMSTALWHSARRAVAFVADANMAPGVKDPEGYAKRVVAFQDALRVRGVPVVSQASGMKIGEDGIQWCGSAQAAVGQLMAEMVEVSKPTKEFEHNDTPATWAWKFVEQYGRHFPYCYKCVKLMTEDHFTTERHMDCGGACGVTKSFIFPNREALCAFGVRFQSQALSKAPGEQNKELWLPAEHPLPDGSGQAVAQFNNSNPVVTEVEMDEEEGLYEHRNGSLPVTFRAKLRWSDGSRTQHRCKFLGAGVHRAVYFSSDGEYEWVVKAQLLYDRKNVQLTNSNKEEWSNCRNIGAVASLVPKVFGYAETQIRGVGASFIFVERIGYTVQELLHKIVENEINLAAIKIVLHIVGMIVNTHIRCVTSGITPHDWHMENLGFEDKKDADVTTLKLIDWQGNKLSSTPEPFQRRMGIPFLLCIENFKIRKNGGVRPGWREITSSIRTTTKTWWNSWCKTNSRVDELPKEEDVRRLDGELFEAAEKVWKAVKEQARKAPQTYGGPQEERQTIREIMGATSVTVDGTKDEGRIPVTRITGRYKSQINIAGNTTRSSPTFFGDTAMITKYQSVRPALETPIRSANFIKVVGEGKCEVNYGQAVVESIMKRIRGEQWKHEQKLFKHGRQPVPGRSIPVEQRIAERKFHPNHGEPPRPVSEGNDVALVFRLFLDYSWTRGYMTRMRKVPKNAFCPVNFHQKYWMKFTEHLSTPWQKMSMSEKRGHLHRFLSEKFTEETSHDPQVMQIDGNQDMHMPSDRGRKRKRKELCWEGFSVTEKEMGGLVDDIMKDYGSEDTT